MYKGYSSYQENGITDFFSSLQGDVNYICVTTWNVEFWLAFSIAFYENDPYMTFSLIPETKEQTTKWKISTETYCIFYLCPTLLCTQGT